MSGFSRFAGKFVLEPPRDSNAFSIYGNAWHYDFDKLSRADIAKIVERDPRPLWCAQTYPDFQNFHVLEAGPGEGYITAALEYLGARMITAVEGNVDAFLRCLIMKNAFDLRAKFILGDFTKSFEVVASPVDLLFACGVLYHLVDPVDFIITAGRHVQHLFLWTHFYDERYVDAIGVEHAAFAGREIIRAERAGHTFTYHRRYYDTAHVESPGYIGGLRHYAYWMTRDDIFAALDIAGFKTIHKIVDDPYQEARMMPAVNILASR